MNRKKLVTISIITLLALAIVPRAYSQITTKTFYNYTQANLTIEIMGPEEANPGDNITISIHVNSSADNLRVKYLYLVIYDFQSGKAKKLIANLTYIKLPGYELNYNQTLDKSYGVTINNDAWDIMYGEVFCEWVIKGTVTERYEIPGHGFIMTYVRNVEMEDLKQQLDDVKAAYDELLNNYTKLNQTYWDLKVNKTSGIETALSNARLAMIILVVTTVFFIATTLYLMVKKPKEYW